MSALESESPARPSSLLIYRLLALFYDFWPVLALWFLVSTLFTLGYTFVGPHELRENIPAFSWLQWVLWLCCWVVTGLYATISWKHGGQTLGMRPWRLHLRALNNNPPTWRALWLRYMAGTLSLACGGLGLIWASCDHQRLTWHDRISKTYLIRLPKNV